MIEKADHEKIDRLSEDFPFSEIILKIYRGKVQQILLKETRYIDKENKKAVTSE